MSVPYKIGARLSFDGAICTVRYFGEVAGTSGEWLGVEWDDPARGKHNGSHKGRSYFTCLSKSATAASFVRPSRKADPAQDFISALHEKYASDESPNDHDGTGKQTPVQIQFSGKVVEEVGFDKIRRRLAQLQDLRVVILDGLRIGDASGGQPGADKAESIKRECPKIMELDLSRNLFTNFGTVVNVCSELAELRTLRLNGNRWQTVLPDETSQTAASAALQNVKDLALDETLSEWREISLIASQAHDLQELSASTNQLSVLVPSNPLPDNLTTLILEYNDFNSLSDLLGISTLQNLRNLHLKGNNISSVESSSSNRGVAPSFPPSLRYLDLSYNQVATWSFVDALQQCFPGMTSLRFAHNPIYDNPDSNTAAFLQAPTATEAPNAGKSHTAATEEAHMLTIGRLPTLQSLNFSTVTATDRLNAETFYLGRIVRQLASVPANSPAEADILASHPRWKELCEIYGEPDVVRRTEINPAFLEARLIKVAVYVASDAGKERTKTIEIPKSFDIYKVKSIVGKVFRHSPRKLRLVWETGEWDPVAGFDDAESDSSDDESGDTEDVHHAKQLAASRTLDPERTQGHSGRWVKREVEISDGPRQFGFCVDGPTAKIRVELLD